MISPFASFRKRVDSQFDSTYLQHYLLQFSSSTLPGARLRTGVAWSLFAAHPKIAARLALALALVATSAAALSAPRSNTPGKFKPPRRSPRLRSQATRWAQTVVARRGASRAVLQARERGELVRSTRSRAPETMAEEAAKLEQFLAFSGGEDETVARSYLEAAGCASPSVAAARSAARGFGWWRGPARSRQCYSLRAGTRLKGSWSMLKLCAWRWVSDSSFFSCGRAGGCLRDRWEVELAINNFFSGAAPPAPAEAAHQDDPARGAGRAGSPVGAGGARSASPMMYEATSDTEDSENAMLQQALAASMGIDVPAAPLMPDANPALSIAGSRFVPPQYMPPAHAPPGHLRAGGGGVPLDAEELLPRGRRGASDEEAEADAMRRALAANMWGGNPEAMSAGLSAGLPGATPGLASEVGSGPANRTSAHAAAEAHAAAMGALLGVPGLGGAGGDDAFMALQRMQEAEFAAQRREGDAPSAEDEQAFLEAAIKESLEQPQPAADDDDDPLLAEAMRASMAQDANAPEGAAPGGALADRFPHLRAQQEAEEQRLAAAAAAAARRSAPGLPASGEVLESRMMREEQDQAYLESLAEDQRKEAEARAAEERARADAQAAAAAAELAAAEAAGRQAEAAAALEQRRRALPAEPPEGAASLVTVVVRLPDGSRVPPRRFAAADSIAHVYTFVDLALADRPGALPEVTSGRPAEVRALVSAHAAAPPGPARG